MFFSHIMVLRETYTISKQQNVVSQTHRHGEQTCGCPQGGGKDWEFGISRCKLLYIEWINNKVLLHCTRNYIQDSVINHNGEEKNC